MEIVVGIAVGVLVVVIIFSIIGIVVAVKTRCCRKSKEDHDHTQNSDDIDVERGLERQDRQLIEELDGDDVSITLQNVLDDDVWIDDMTGVMNHCIPILKGCHELSSKLVPVTKKFCESDEDNKKIEQMALEVQPRLDDVVQLLEGPLDPRLIEARCTALYYAVSNLCLVIKNICKDSDGIGDWIDSSLQETEGHLKILQAETQNLYRRSTSGSVRGHTKDSSPVCELSLSGTHSNSSRGSGSHSDSAESGIDLQTPSERGSEHAPHSPSFVDRDHNNESDEDEVACSKKKDIQSGCTIAEVHNCDNTEVIEMSSFQNDGYTVTAE